MVFDESVSNIDNDEIKSFMIIKSGCLILFDECDFKGFYYNTCNNQSNTEKDPDDDIFGKYKSMILGPDTRVAFYSDIDYQGTKSEILTSNVSCFKENNIIKAKSILLNGVEMEIYKSGYSSLNFMMGLIMGFSNEERFHKNLKNNDGNDREELESCIEGSMEKDNVEDINEGEEYAKSMGKVFDAVYETTSWVRKYLNWYCNFKENGVRSVTQIVNDKIDSTKKTVKGAVKDTVDTVKDTAGAAKKTVKSVKEILESASDPKKSITDIIKSANKSYKEGKDTVDTAMESGEKIKDSVESIKSLGSSFKKYSEKMTDEKIVNDILSDSQTYEQNKRKIRRMMRKDEMKRLRRKHRRGTPVKRKYRVEHMRAKNFFDDWIKKIKDYIKEKMQQAMEALGISNIVKKVKAYLKGKLMKKIIKILNCAKTVLRYIIRLVKSLFKLIQIFIFAIASIAAGGLGIIILLDLVLAQLCQYKHISQGLSYYKAAVIKKNENDNLLSKTYYGLAVGTFIQSFLSADSYATRYFMPDD